MVSKQMRNVVTEGCSVLLDINHGDRFTFSRAYPSSTVKFGNLKYSLAPLIGCPFGSIFEVSKDPKGHHLVKVSQETELQSSEFEKAEVSGVEDRGIWNDKDNRHLIDDNTAQSLSELEISYMKRDGASGMKIVEALIANSASFQNKTSLSQAKYKRKKQKKHAPCIVIRCPSARSICEAYFVKEPSKIGFLRMDMLAVLLSLGNVGANADVLVLDELGGLLTAAIVERLGGFGTVCSTYWSSKMPSLGMLGLFNFMPVMSRSILCAPLHKLIEARSLYSTQRNKETALQTMVPLTPPTDLLSAPQTNTTASLMDQNNKLSLEKRDETEARMSKSLKASTIDSAVLAPVRIPATAQAISCSYKLNEDLGKQATAGVEHLAGLERDESNVEGTGHPADEMDVEPQFDEPEDESKTSFDGGADTTSEPVLAVENAALKQEFLSKTSKPGMHAPDDQVAYWAQHGFSSLIIGAPELEPWYVCKKMLQLLSPSAPFVIYHPYMQPLADCMHQLRKERLAINLQLSEPWLREYQVLPSQTHPHMQMSSTTGFCLSGICTIQN